MKKKVIAIIPARAGSKRLKDKNILKFYKKPLVTWAIESALKSCMIDTVLVTSNSKRVEKICSKFKKVIFSKRPNYLSRSKSLIEDVIQHEIKKNDLNKYDYFILLQPTSPLRKVKDIDKSLKMTISNNVKTCVSFSNFNFNLKNIYKIKNKKIYKIFNKMSLKEKDKLIIPSGDFYISSLNHFIKNNNFYEPQTLPYLVSSYSDIDTLNEFQQAEFTYKNN